jgi:hypothetical protein
MPAFWEAYLLVAQRTWITSVVVRFSFWRPIMAKVAEARRLSKVELVAEAFAENLLEVFRKDCKVTRSAKRTGIVTTPQCFGVDRVLVQYEIGKMCVNVFVDVFDRSNVFKLSNGAPEVFGARWCTFPVKSHYDDADRYDNWRERTFDVPQLLMAAQEIPKCEWHLALNAVMGMAGVLVNRGEQKVVLDCVERGREFCVRPGESLAYAKFDYIEQFKLVQDWAKGLAEELKGMMKRHAAETPLFHLGIYPEYGNIRLMK